MGGSWEREWKRQGLDPLPSTCSTSGRRGPAAGGQTPECPEAAALSLDHPGGRPWHTSLPCSIFVSSWILDSVSVVVVALVFLLLLLFRRFSLII